MGSRKVRLTTGISSQFVIIRSSCSTTSAIVREPSCGRGTSSAPTAGRKSCHGGGTLPASGGASALPGATAAFTKPEMYEYLELQSIGYAIRLPVNDILEQEIKKLRKRFE